MDDRDMDKLGFEEARRRADALPVPPEEYENPPGVGGDTCDVEPAVEETEPCDPSGAEDMVMEESKPGIGILGFEGEEVGGG